MMHMQLNHILKLTHKLALNQLLHKEKLVDDGHAGHGFRAESADHDIVQQRYEIGYDILDQKGNHDL